MSLGKSTSHKVEKTLLNLTSFFIEICNRFYSNGDLIKSQPRIAIASDYNRIRRNRERLIIYIAITAVTLKGKQNEIKEVKVRIYI